ncbi:MAG: M24 family metallopeptidase [Tepidisphaeraceae bacterium]
MQLVGEYENGLIDVARRTKDADEIARLEDAGRRSCDVVRVVVEKLKSLRERDGLAVDASGSPVTIGQIKRLIAQACDERDLEQLGDNIFAQGRDAGIPHAHGNVGEPLRVGMALLFDFFPRCKTSGYFHDMTRTFALGHAPDELRKVYDDVKAAFDAAMSALTLGGRTKGYHDLVCDVLRKRGHPTILDRWPLEEGYCHSLGHGLGIQVHEAPSLGGFVDRGDVLEKGSVVTVEPGLYYPNRNLGVRIEDTVVVDPETGAVRSITPFPYELVVPLAK